MWRNPARLLYFAQAAIRTIQPLHCPVCIAGCAETRSIYRKESAVRDSGNKAGGFNLSSGSRYS